MNFRRAGKSRLWVVLLLLSGMRLAAVVAYDAQIVAALQRSTVGSAYYGEERSCVSLIERVFERAGYLAPDYETGHPEMVEIVAGFVGIALGRGAVSLLSNPLFEQLLVDLCSTIAQTQTILPLMSSRSWLDEVEDPDDAELRKTEICERLRRMTDEASGHGVSSESMKALVQFHREHQQPRQQPEKPVIIIKNGRLQVSPTALVYQQR